MSATNERCCCGLRARVLARRARRPAQPGCRRRSPRFPRAQAAPSSRRRATRRRCGPWRRRRGSGRRACRRPGSARRRRARAGGRRRGRGRQRRAARGRRRRRCRRGRAPSPDASRRRSRSRRRTRSCPRAPTRTARRRRPARRRTARTRPLVAGDPAGDRLVGRHEPRCAHACRPSDAQRAARAVRHELDRADADVDQVAFLPHPRQHGDVTAVHRAEEDVFERRALERVAALVDVQHDAPRRAGLVVVVADDERGREARDVDVVDAPVLDRPREDAEADAVRRAPALHPADHPARADRLAVARFEVRAADSIGHRRTLTLFPRAYTCSCGRARAVQPDDTCLVRERVPGADSCAGGRLAGDRLRRARSDPGSDGLGQDARRVSLRDRPAERDAGRGPAPDLRLAAEGAELRHRAQPARPARGSPVEASRRRAHRRHAAEGAAGDGQGPAGHPDHDAGVALPDADVGRARDPARRRHADPRRGARGRRHEARRAHGADGRAARGAERDAVPAHRPVGDAAPDGRDRPLRLRRAPDPARRRGHAQGARPAGDRAARRHARAGAGRRRAGHPRHRRRAAAAVDLAVDLPEDPGARPRAPLDDRLRQQPPARRAPRAAPERPRERRQGRRRPARGDRTLAPRLARARAAADRRGRAEGRTHPVSGRDLVARARHRHGRGRPRDPGRVAEVGRARAAAHRSRRATSSAPSRAGASSRSSAPTCSSRPSSRAACSTARSRRRSSRATRSTCSRSRSSRSPPTRRSPSTTCTGSCAAPTRSRSSRARSSRTCSTCSRAATRPTSSPSFGRASSGTARQA